MRRRQLNCTAVCHTMACWVKLLCKGVLDMPGQPQSPSQGFIGEQRVSGPIRHANNHSSTSSVRGASHMVKARDRDIILKPTELFCFNALWHKGL